MADHNNPQSRNEEILMAIIDGEEYNKPPQSRIEELLLELKEVIEAGGGGGTSDYTRLQNLPTINNVTLTGDMTAADLNLVLAEVGKGLSTNDYSNEEKAKVANLLTAIQSILDGTDLDSFGDVEVALLDKADISDLGTAALKDSTNAVTSGSTDLVESGAVKDAIDAAVSSAYHHAGTKTVAQLTHDLLVAANEGNVYNITDSGTTTSDFIEGIGKTIDEGSNVGICKVGNVYMFDLLSGFVDTTNFVQKSQTAGLLKNDGTVDTDIEGDVDSLKSGLTNLDNEVNGDATVYPYADVITINDAIPANLADCSVKVEPVQDLHGYDHPWVGGAGKNKFDGVSIISANITQSGAISSESINNKVIYTPCKANTTYTVSKIAGTSFRVAYCDSIPTFGTQCSGLITDNTASSITITTGNTAGYIAAWVWNASDTTDVSDMIASVQVEEGNQATAWSPYENICPISGHTEASVQRDGKNLFDKSATGIVVGKYLNSETGELVNSTNNWNTSDYIYVGGLGGESITFSGLNNIGASNFSVCYYDKNNNFISGLSGKVMTLTIPSDERIAYLRFDYRQVDADDVQLELGSTATPYEPFKGKTYTIQLGDTIYGGTVDFDSGVMTVTHAIVDAGDLTYNEGSSSFYSSNITDFKHSGSSGNLYATYCISSEFEYYGNSDWEQDANGFSLYYNPSVPGCRLVFNKKIFDGYTTTQFKQWLTDNSVQVCYELATPTTIQLTPQQIQLLKGTNTLTASTGQISVTVNGVSGAIGQIQEQVNENEERIDAVESELDEVANVVNVSTQNIKLFNTADNNITAEIHATTNATEIVNDKYNNGAVVNSIRLYLDVNSKCIKAAYFDGTSWDRRTILDFTSTP